MCISYQSTPRPVLHESFDASLDENLTWPDEVWQDYATPIIIRGADNTREVIVGSYGMVPKRHMPPKVRLTTMNARSETVGTLRSYAPAWRASQLCLVPMQSFYEPNWETHPLPHWHGGWFTVCGGGFVAQLVRARWIDVARIHAADNLRR